MTAIQRSTDLAINVVTADTRGGKVSPTGLPEVLWREIIKNEINSVVPAVIDNTVLFLIVNFVGLSHLKLIAFAIQNKSHTAIGHNGNMNAMAVLK